MVVIQAVAQFQSPLTSYSVGLRARPPPPQWECCPLGRSLLWPFRTIHLFIQKARESLLCTSHHARQWAKASWFKERQARMAQALDTAGNTEQGRPTQIWRVLKGFKDEATVD